MIRIISFIVALVFAFCLLLYNAGAVTYTIGDNEYYDLPYHHIDQYPATMEGYLAFVKDTCAVCAYDYSNYKGWDEVNNTWNDCVTYFFGDDTALALNVPDPRQALSGYYNQGGSTYVPGATQWTDGHGGYFHLEFANYREGGYSYIALYWNDRYISCVDQGTGWYKNARIECYGTDDPNVVNVKVYGDYESEWGAYESLCINANVDTGAPANPHQETTSVPVGGSVGGKHGHLERDPNGVLHFVDDDGNDYLFNDDGTVTGDDGKPYYFLTDPDDITDDLYKKMKDLMDYWGMMMLVALTDATDDNGNCNCTCCSNKKDATDLALISAIYQQCYQINKNTDQIEGLLGMLLLGSVTDEEKEKNAEDLAAIMTLLSNAIPYSAVAISISILEEIIFQGGTPAPIQFDYHGESITVLTIAQVNQYDDAIGIVKGLLSVMILYSWLLFMRKRVLSL